MKKKYHIEFFTLDKPGYIEAVSVELNKELIKDDKTTFNIDLADHPLYPSLVQYVLNNPPDKFGSSKRPKEKS